MLDYEYIKNHYRLITVPLSKQKEFDAEPKEIQQIDFVRELKNIDYLKADGTWSMFVWTILEKMKETRLKVSEGKITVF